MVIIHTNTLINCKCGKNGEGDFQDPLTFLWVAPKRKKLKQGKDYLITTK